MEGTPRIVPLLNSGLLSGRVVGQEWWFPRMESRTGSRQASWKGGQNGPSCASQRLARAMWEGPSGLYPKGCEHGHVARRPGAHWSARRVRCRARPLNGSTTSRSLCMECWGIMR